MSSKEGSSALISTMTIFCGATGAAAALLIAGAVTLSPRHAQATPAYAVQTKLPCGQCHVNPAGGLPTNNFGKAFAANGHKLPLPKDKQ
jgi:hypothetical protein